MDTDLNGKKKVSGRLPGQMARGGRLVKRRRFKIPSALRQVGFGFALAGLLALVWPARGEEPSPEKDADSVFNAFIKTNEPGVAVLVAQNGKILFEKGYGLADVEHRVAITPATKFRIGSITKQFTAAAILKLQEEGKLSVTDKLSKYIPDYPRGDEVTLQHLLTHTSGIHNFTQKQGFMQRVTNAVAIGDLIKWFKNDPYDFDPGAKTFFENSGYVLLGYIVEKVSGENYGTFLREKFFQPLGMTNTGVYRANLALTHEALGYSYEDHKYQRAVNWDMSWAGGAGALYSTVEDLYRWNEGIFNGKVLNEASLKAAFTPVKTKENEEDNSGDGYGYGWGITTLRGEREISHAGGLSGFRSFLLRLPKENFTVVLLGNAGPVVPGPSPEAFARQVAQLYLAGKLPPPEELVANPNVPPGAFEAVAGRYDCGGPVLMVTKEGNQLFAQFGRQKKMEIFPLSETNFFWKEYEARVTFVKDKSGKAIKAIYRQGDKTIYAPRLEALAKVRVNPAVYDRLAGKYDYGVGKSILTVTREGNHLYAQMTGQPKLELFPKSEMEYSWQEINAQVTFVKDDKGRVTKALYHQGGKTFEARKVE